MYFTGFADEAAVEIEGQIKATKALGWKCIESRNISKRNIHDIPDEEFEKVVAALNETDVTINCFGSVIANWGKKITEPFDSSLDEARRAIPRMKRLGTKMIRIMSFAVIADRSPEDQMKEERFKRLRELVAMFSSEGILPVHENCMNYGGMGWKYTLELLENVPGLSLAFDTGNPVFTDDRMQSEPYQKQSAWEFYDHIKEHVSYIHIKDGIWSTEEKKMQYTFPGEGNGDVRRILTDLFRRGYDGGISIEPHMGAVFHDPAAKTDEDRKYQMYIEYGTRLEIICKEIRNEI